MYGFLIFDLKSEILLQNNSCACHFLLIFLKIISSFKLNISTFKSMLCIVDLCVISTLGVNSSSELI